MKLFYFVIGIIGVCVLGWENVSASYWSMICVILFDIFVYVFFFSSKKINENNRNHMHTGYIALFTLYFMCDMVTGQNSSMALIVRVFFAFILLCYIYDEDPQNLLVCLLVIRCILAACDAMASSVLVLMLNEGSFDNFSFSNEMGMGAIMVSRFYVLGIMYSLRKRRNIDFKAATFADRMFIMVPTSASMILLFILMYHIQNADRANYVNVESVFSMSLVILLSTVCSFVFYDYYLKIKQKDIDYQKTKYYMQYQHQYYEQKNQMDLEVRKMYHDMKQHLIYLHAFGNKQAKGEEYIQTIMEKIRKYESYVDTGNNILNTLMNEKMKLAENKSIRIDCGIDFHDGSFIEPLDISVIFGNALDNCIEACEEVVDVSKRFIIVKTRSQNGLVSIKFVNSKIGKLIYKSHHIITKKEEKLYHGFGIVNIQEAVSKYHGVCLMEEEEDTFTLKIVIPLPEQE